jgi:hypothetical protein
VTWTPRTLTRRTTRSVSRPARSVRPDGHHAELSAILAKATVAANLDSVVARVLHTVNLPGGTDVNRLDGQIGELDRQVHQLRP